MIARATTDPSAQGEKRVTVAQNSTGRRRQEYQGEPSEPDRHRREVHESGDEPEHDRVTRDRVATGGDHGEDAEGQR